MNFEWQQFRNNLNLDILIVTWHIANFLQQWYDSEMISNYFQKKNGNIKTKKHTLKDILL